MVQNQIGISDLAGGIAAEMTGGNFTQGFANGLIVAGLNHAAEGIEKQILQNQLNKVFANYPMNGNDEITPQKAFEMVNPAAAAKHLSGDLAYQNACATRLSLAFVKAGVKIPNGYGGIKDVNGNRIIISAQQMYNFMSAKYGALMTTYSSGTSTKGIYIGLAKYGAGYSGHVTIIKPGFNSFTIDSRAAYFWSIK